MDSEDGQPAPEVPETFGYMNKSPEVLEVLEECLQKRTTPAGLDYEDLRGLVKPGAAGLLTRMEYSREGSSTWLRPTSFVSTQIGVELVDGLGN